MKNTKLSLALAGLLTLSTSAFADDKADIAELKQQVKDLQEMTQTLTDETSNLQTGFNYTKADSTKSHSGLGPAASKIYYSKSPLSIGGYGEMYYATTDTDGAALTAETQVKRFITYFGYKFSDNIILNAEVEYEGGGVVAGGSANTTTGDISATGDEVVIEFMYLDFLQNKNFNLRVGNFLVPLGLTNQQHEPTLFTTVQRPKTSYYIIPTTWNESGVMAYGDIVNGLEYKVALLTALQPNDNGADKWLRQGRGSSFVVSNPRAAGVARVDYTGLNGLLIGTSLYTDENMYMYDAHVDYKVGAARVYGTYAQTQRSITNPTISQVTASYGAYLNASYDILSLIDSEKKLPLFVQYEKFNAQEKVSQGAPANNDTENVSLGINFFPHEQVVLKADYVLSKTGTIHSNTASVSLGFIF